MNKPEPQPIPNGGPPVWEMVIADMRERDNTGFQKYGTRLQPNNGRNALVDAYQEALDLAVYLRQVIAEQSNTRTPSPPPSSAEVRARARELVDEWRNTWRGMSDACMTANRIDLIDRIARLSTPQPTLECGLCDSTDLKFCAECFDKPSRRARARSAECERLVNEREALRVELEKLSAQPTLQQAIECVRDYRKWYDEKMFTPVTTEETQAVHKQFDGMVDRISAAMARHLIDKLIEQLESLASTQE